MTRDELVTEYTPMVKRIANRIMVTLPFGFDINDLVSAGYIGLLQAIDNGDVEHESFSLYAEKYIEGVILKDINRNGGAPEYVRVYHKTGGSNNVKSLEGQDGMDILDVSRDGESPLNNLLRQERLDLLDRAMDTLNITEQQVVRPLYRSK